MRQMFSVLAWRYAIGDGTPRRSLAVAIVVGTILNLINQGDTLLLGGPINPWKLGLTYLVPYCVATYGAVAYRLATTVAAPVPVPAIRTSDHTAD